ncbi:adenine deaminase [Aliidongia dinghuensis]|uniref:Adenine deaminase n=1 Tax=Aliidongia dinghuensis TaxID=1867774 RepID=A0A8J2YQP5_9PROT|nr:adenine deaminase [Aliidongia dinghuensis]GGF05899.1 adenine deaminase [Aliidongia dinghuensis]
MTLGRDDLKRRIDQARGSREADLVVKNTRMLDMATGEIVRTDIAVCGDVIVGTYDLDYRGRQEIDGSRYFAVPGFIDTHVHPESTLVLPDQFDRLLLGRGTTTAIADPHEIANVLGTPGLEYFIAAAGVLAMDLRINLASCVPATPLETSGARLDAAALVALRGRPQVLGLAEFMNFPGVLAKTDEVLDKLVAFQDGHIDGHAPLLGGRDLNAYLSCGIRNCHESTSLAEAGEKLRKGMQVLIRDGSVTRDVHALAPLIDITHSPFLGFCTDDRTPLHIVEDGHLDHLIRTAIAKGRPAHAVYRAATWSAANHFGLKDRGILAPGRLADIVLLDDLDSCAVARVIRAGRPVGPETFAGRRLPPAVGYGSVKRAPVSATDFAVPCGGPTGPVIGLRVNQIVTDALTLALPYRAGERHPDPAQDVAKVAVLERHGRNGNIGRGFVKGFGLTGGALASSIGHDAHNIITVGLDDADMALAVNRLIELQGGFVAVRDGRVLAELALPVAGLMSDQSAEDVEADLRHLRAAVRDLGCQLAEPFVQMAFLPLSVIPHLKITDHGLIDVDRFQVIGLDG